MGAIASIFFELNLPNPTTWFYFSGLLAVALFFKFSRLLSVRNLDVLTLFLFMPGLLLIAERGTHAFLGYLWLLAGCLYFLGRCLLDLTLVRRPALGANLNFGGLAWLIGSLFVGLVAVAARQPVGLRSRISAILGATAVGSGSTGLLNALAILGCSVASPATAEIGADLRPPTEETRSPTPIEKLPKIVEPTIQPYAPPGTDDSSLRVWAERGLALLCHLSIITGLVLIGWRHFDDVQAGMSAATFYLLLPYTYLLLPDSPLGVGRWDHAWPMALVVWAVFAYRRPILAGSFLGVAAGTAFYVLAILPAWLSFYRERGAGRFLASFVLSAGLGLAVLGGLLWLNGELPSSLQSDWTKFDWQPWKRPPPQTPGFWQDIPSQSVLHMPAAYRVPVFIGSMALVILSAFWPAPKNLAQVLALSAAALISIQFWYADRGGVYVLWFLPLLLLLVFRPNLSASRPPPVPADDWIARLRRRLLRAALRRIRRHRAAERAA
jgi:hypothetical protein